jgi:hypothetical protein
MLETLLALAQGFELDENKTFVYKFGDGYELCFEPLIFDEQWYLALYQNQQLLIPKVVVKIGKK